MDRRAREKLLIVAPHPDDEVLGCGGLIQRVKMEGGKVYVIYATVGDTRDFSSTGFSSQKERLKEIEDVARFLEIDEYYASFVGNGYHLKLDTVGTHKLINEIERESPISIEKIKPTILAFPHASSYNQDHRAVASAAHAAARPAGRHLKHFVPTVLSFEEAPDIWTLGLPLIPNYFVELTQEIVDKKLEALTLYRSQYRDSPNLRANESLKSLAIMRGGLAGVQLAEGFYAWRNLLSI